MGYRQGYTIWDTGGIQGDIYGIQAGYTLRDAGRIQCKEYRQDTIHGIQAGYTIWDTGRIYYICGIQVGFSIWDTDRIHYCIWDTGKTLHRQDTLHSTYTDRIFYMGYRHACAHACRRHEFFNI